MATLKIKIHFFVKNCPKLIFQNQFSKYVFQEQRWLFICEGDGHWWKSPSHLNIYLCYRKTYYENLFQNISFRAIFYKKMNFNFQGCHIYGNLENFKLNGNPDQKSNIRLLIKYGQNNWNLIFVFQGSQKRHVRVPIFHKGLAQFL